MRNFVILALFASFVFGKININEADRYTLMTFGKLDAGRADMLINYRKNREITSINELKLITGFANFDTKILEENFEILALPKPEISQKQEPEKEKVKIIEKTKIIHAPPRYERVQKFGDIEIIERGSIPQRHINPNHKRPRYEEFPKHRHYEKHENSANFSVGGSVKFEIRK